MAANLVLDFYDELMILVHTDKPPSTEEWSRYIAGVKRFDPEKLRTLVFTDGGAPNSEQRKEINDALNGKTSLGAVVSDSRLVRGVVTTMSWFNPKIKAFSPERTEEAFKYVGIEPVLVPRVWVIVRRLREKLGAPNLRCIAASLGESKREHP